MASHRVNMIFGNTRKRDHICWPTMPPDDAQDLLQACIDDNGLDAVLGTVQRPDCNLDQIMAVVWRVKEWRFSGSVRLDTPTGGGILCEIEDSPTPNKMLLQTQYPDYLGINNAHDITDERLIASELPSTPNGVGGLYTDDYLFPLRNSGFISPIMSGFNNRRLRIKYTNLLTSAEFTNTNAPIYFFDNTRGLDVVKWDGTDPDDPIFQPFFFFDEAAGIEGFDIRTPVMGETATSDRFFTLDPLIAEPIQCPLIFTSDFGILSTASDIKATAHKFFPYAGKYNEDTGEPVPP